MKKFFSTLVACFLVFLLPNLSPVQAGGGTVALNPTENPHQWFNVQNRMVTLFVNLDPLLPCSGAQVTFDYESKEAGDSIKVGASNTNSYTIPGPSTRIVNGKQLYNCQAVGTYLSSNKKLKIAQVTVSTTDGQIQTRQAALNFQTEYPSGNYNPTLPWDNNPYIFSITQKQAKSLNPIIINGSGFGDFNKYLDFVIFNIENSSSWKEGPQASILSWSDRTIVAQVPYLSQKGIYQVKVGNRFGLSNNATIEIISAQPNISNISPTTLTRNSEITIQGTEFGTSGGRVSIHTPKGQLLAICQPQSWTTTEIKCKIQIYLNPNSEYAIQVYSRDNIGSQFKYLYNGQLSDCSPSQGCG